VEGTAKASPLFAEYGARVDAESAREIIAARLERAAPPTAAPAPPRPKAPRAPKPPPAPESPTDRITDFLGSRQGKALQKQVMRGVFGMLKKRI
jgi:uncharacterized protein